VVKDRFVKVVSKNGTTLGVKGRGPVYFRSHWRFIKEQAAKEEEQ
jgi:hypothetical protein